jgi:hypothetical protein
VELAVPFHQPKEHKKVVLTPANLGFVAVCLVALHTAAVNIFELLYGRYGFSIDSRQKAFPIE